MMVIHVVVAFRPGHPEVSPRNPLFSALKANGMAVAGSEGAAIHPAAAAREGEPIVVKHRISPFVGTDLETLLRDAIIGGQWSAHDLGKRISSKELRDAYAGYCRQHGLRPVNEEVFGKGCTQMFGSRVRLSPDNSNRRPWGYDLPDGDTWHEKLNARLGIKI
jgi:hypothetical protein